MDELLYDDDDALNEMDSQLGPDIQQNEYQQFPNFEMSRKRKKRKLKKSERAYAALPDHLNEIMMNANMMYIQGREDDAIQMLKNVIKERPDAHEAWLTLAMIYNAKGDVPRMVQCRMMAAHLSATNGDLWRPLGYSSMDLGEMDQALYCFRKATNFDPEDSESYWELSQIYISRNLTELAIDALAELARLNPLDLKIIKQVSSLYLQTGQAALGAALFERVMHEDSVNPLSQTQQPQVADEVVLGQVSFGRKVLAQRMGYEELNMVCELYFEMQDFQKALDVLTVGVNRLHGYPETNQVDLSVAKYNIPVELHTKFAICYLHLNRPNAAAPHLDKLYNVKPIKGDVSVYAEQFFEIVDVYMKKKEYHRAIEALHRLIDTEEADRPMVWSLLGECYAELNDFEESISMYENALELDPGNKEIRNAVILMYEDLGQEEKAHELLFKFHELGEAREKDHSQSAFQTPISSPAQKQSSSKSLINLTKSELKKSKKPSKERDKQEQERQILENVEFLDMIHKIEHEVHHNIKKIEFLKLARQLLARLDNSAKSRSKTKKNEDSPWSSFKAVVVQYPDRYVEDPRIMNTKFEGITYQDWFQLIVKFIKVLAKDGKMEDADAAIKLAMDRQIFYNDPKMKYELTLLLLTIHVHFGDYGPLSYISRWFGLDDPYNTEDCRIHSGIFPRNDTAFHHFGGNTNQRYFLRRIQKLESADAPLQVIAHHYCHMGHFLLESRNYLMAIQYYQKARKVFPDDPVINLCLGVSYLQKSTQKLQSRPDNILKAFAYLKHYQRVRGDCAESNYNIARALHGIGINHLAIKYYEKALKPLQGYEKAAAYNLSLIYMTTGSPQLAQRILYDHSKW